MAVGSFSAGLSGLDANSVYLRVIGNNLANINTVGFKASDVTFADLVSQSLGGDTEDPVQVGLGVATGSITPNFGQGAIENTEVPTNVAIQGAGLFVLSGGDGVSFTRAGNFSLDSNGTLVTPDGHKVQGYTSLDSSGTIITTTPPTDIIVPPGVLRPPRTTTSFQTVTNLDAGASVGAKFATSVQVYDSLGTAHTASINYTKATPTTWNFDISVPGDEITGGTAGTPFSVASGSLTFASDGTLSNVNNAAPADVSITTPTWVDGAAQSNLQWDVINSIGIGTVTGYASASATSSVSQDGSAPGQLNNLQITTDGRITATVGAGQTVAVGQLAIANFNNPEGLVKVGDNRFAPSQAAGISNVGVAGTGGRGTLIGAALEQSNVDIAKEFTNMIIAQRGYQANAKSITVSDQLLVDTLNLKQ
jgi:flagellar hook protein FlgE